MNGRQHEAEELAFIERVVRFQDGRLNSVERQALEEEMLASPEKRKLFTYLQLSSLALSEQLRQEVFELAPASGMTHPSWGPWFPWMQRIISRPWQAMVIGIFVGLFSATVVFGYRIPRNFRPRILLMEGFEGRPALSGEGMKAKSGEWSGDVVEVVREEQAVKPAHGKKMLRFIRSEQTGRSSSSRSQSTDTYRLFDVRSYRHEFSSQESVVRLSACFNGIPFPADEKYECSLSIYALSHEAIEPESGLNESNLLRHSLAVARKTLPRMDRDPASWERVEGELRLPPETEFLIVRLGIHSGSELPSGTALSGHYADDVRLILARSRESR